VKIKCFLGELFFIYSKQKKFVEQGAKTCFVHFECKYLAICMVKVSEISCTHSYTSLVTDPIVTYGEKKILSMPKK
jgi:hypothetical protein